MDRILSAPNSKPLRAYGIELYITRAEFWADNEDAPITADEWLAYIKSDPELSLDTSQGDHFARWHGKSAYEEPWLDWFQGKTGSLIRPLQVVPNNSFKPAPLCGAA